MPVGEATGNGFKVRRMAQRTDTMSMVTMVLDRTDAEQLAKRLKNPYQLRVSREQVFQNLLAALESALKNGESAASSG